MSQQVVFGDEPDDDDTYVPAQRAQDSGPSSFMDALAQELKSQVTIEPIRLVIDGRPNISIEYWPDIEADKVRHWQNRTRIKVSRESEVNILQFSILVIRETARRIFWNNKPVNDTDGQPLRMHSPAFFEMCAGSGDINQALKWLYGTDAEILQHAKKVMEDAGYSPDGEPLEADDESDPLS